TPMDFKLHHTVVTAPATTPTQWMLVLHGIFGTGSNLRTFAKRLAEASPDWGFVLVDLRMHGASHGAPPPHTVHAAALDLLDLERQLGDRAVAAVMGHSLGGRVALAYLGIRSTPLDVAFILDSSPGRSITNPDPRGLEGGTTGEVL